jgi:hypothetical protein
MEMERRALRIFVLLWLGWYLSGPMAQMVDFWDTPPQEMNDIARSTCGMVALVGTGLAVTLGLIRRLSRRYRLPLRRLFGLIVIRVERSLPAFIPVILNPSHSPPVRLRI